jgi:hypothetical protein
MERWRPAFAAAVAALALAGCGSDEPPPFKTVSQPASTATSSPSSSQAEVTIDSQPPLAQLLSKLRAPMRARLAAIVPAQATLADAARAVDKASADAQQIVDRIGTGNAAPGGSAPEVAQLSEALGGLDAPLAELASGPTLLPRLSRELQDRAKRLDSARPSVAAKLLAAKDKVDLAIGLIPRLQREIADARNSAREQQKQESLDADKLHDAIAAGRDNAAKAVATVDDAMVSALTALDEAA